MPIITTASLALKEERMEIIDVVRKLVGPVNPIGVSAIDQERFKNLEVLTSRRIKVA